MLSPSGHPKVVSEERVHELQAAARFGSLKRACHLGPAPHLSNPPVESTSVWSYPLEKPDRDSRDDGEPS
jgi:hypothetical protein